MNYENILQSKMFKKVLCGIAVFVVALCIFHVGMLVGYHKAAFSYRFGDNYHRTFGSPEGRGMGMMGSKEGSRGFFMGEFTPAYGVTGTIVKVSLPTIIVAGTDKVEKVVAINEKTLVRRFREDIKTSDLKVGDTVVVIGSPNESAQIEAKLIRILPAGAGLNGSGATSTLTK